jgi:hypothetical protein
MDWGFPSNLPESRLLRLLLLLILVMAGESLSGVVHRRCIISIFGTDSETFLKCTVFAVFETAVAVFETAVAVGDCLCL